MNNLLYNLKYNRRKEFINALTKVKHHNELMDEFYPLDSINYKELVEINPSLSFKDDIIKDVIRVVENVIPEDTIGNFESNLEKMNVIFNEPDVSDIYFRDKESYKEYNPQYKAISNEIVFSKEHLRLLICRANYEKNPENFYYTELFDELLHEMFHVASTAYSSRNLSGLINIFSEKDYSHSSRALTEGYVDYLTVKEMNRLFNYDNPFAYKEFINIASQFETLVGESEFKNIFFNVDGMEAIYRSLEEKGVSKEKVKNVVNNINEYFKCRKDDHASDALGYINLFLNELLLDRVNYMINNNVDKKEIIELLNRYNDSIVTNDRLNYYYNGKSKHLLINESINDYKAIKRKVLTKLG